MEHYFTELDTVSNQRRNQLIEKLEAYAKNNPSEGYFLELWPENPAPYDHAIYTAAEYYARGDEKYCVAYASFYPAEDDHEEEFNLEVY